MKKSTVDNKLNALLGIKTETVEEIKTRHSGKVVGISEEEIQKFREMQGVLYYLQAPALFTAKVCPHCGENFLVSRKYVQYCSYTCIRKSLNELGIEWTKGNDLEALANDPQVYNGNEPIWIKNKVLESLEATLQNLSQNLNDGPEQSAGLSNTQDLNPEPTSSPTITPLTSPTSTSALTQTTSETKSSTGTTAKKSTKPKRIFTS